MSNNNLFILNFHSVFPQNKEHRYHYDPVFSISEEQFINYLNWIISQKINITNWKNILTSNYSSTNQIAISFDDGHLSDYEIVIPILQQLKIDACFFIIAEKIQNDQITKERVQKISDLGYSIGSHGLTHKKLTSLNKKEQLYELLESKKIIEDCIGKEIHFIAFPEGRFNRRLLKLCEKVGYSKTFSTFNKWNSTFSLSNNFGRWSIKQNTTFDKFEKTILKYNFTVISNRFLSILKFYLLKTLDLINLKSKKA